MLRRHNLQNLVIKAERNQDARERKGLKNRVINSGESSVHFLPTPSKRKIVLKVFAPHAFNKKSSTSFQSQLSAIAGSLNRLAKEFNKRAQSYEKMIREEESNPHTSFYPSPRTALSDHLKSREGIKNIASVRIPKIIAEEEIAGGRYAVAMERILGPNFDELLQASEGQYRKDVRGEFVKKFVKDHKIDPTKLRNQIAQIQEDITYTTRHWGSMSANPFIFRLDSFLVEGIDAKGNFKLVLVDLK